MRKEIKKQLQTIMDQAVKDNQIAGMNMMVIKDGQEAVSYTHLTLPTNSRV